MAFYWHGKSEFRCSAPAARYVADQCRARRWAGKKSLQRLTRKGASGYSHLANGPYDRERRLSRPQHPLSRSQFRTDPSPLWVRTLLRPGKAALRPGGSIQMLTTRKYPLWFAGSAMLCGLEGAGDAWDLKTATPVCESLSL